MGHKTHRNAIVFTLFYPYSTFDYYVDIEIEKICNIVIELNNTVVKNHDASAKKILTSEEINRL